MTFKILITCFSSTETFEIKAFSLNWKLLFHQKYITCFMVIIASLKQDIFNIHALLLGHVQVFVTPRLQPTRLLSPWNSPGKNTRGGRHSVLQGILPTQELNLGLLHPWKIHYHLSYHRFAYVCIYMCVCVCVCVCVISICIYIYIQTYTKIQKRTYIYEYSYTGTQLSIYMYA